MHALEYILVHSHAHALQAFRQHLFSLMATDSTSTTTIITITGGRYLQADNSVDLLQSVLASDTFPSCRPPIMPTIATHTFSCHFFFFFYLVWFGLVFLFGSSSASGTGTGWFWFWSWFATGTGNNADTQFVAGVIEARMEAYRTEFGRSPTVRAAATATRNLCYANKDQLSAGIICAGWDEREGGSIFSVPQVEKMRAWGGRGEGVPV